ncbi:MAG TPA: hypothetical protein VGG37_06355 [Opitutaceae bacterium]|jgi:hypothetical protein
MPEESIKESLQALMDAIKRADGNAISDRMAEVEGLTSESRANLHPQLLHFLERRSYAKALQFLGGASSIPTGSCGGRA